MAKKATAAAAFGTFIEYYDFSVYGYTATALAAVFFPYGNATTGLLNTLLVFGSAFIVRPLGAVVFGWLGDRVGRRSSLIASITLMGLSATLIGVLPGYAVIGIWAPLLLVLLRILQGFSAGGEIGGASSYVHEWAPPDKRSFYISLLPTIAQYGRGLAIAVAGLSAFILGDAGFITWGWRIAFLLALPLGITGLIARLVIEDSPAFIETRTRNELSKNPFAELLVNHWQSLLKCISIATVQSIGTYIGTVFVAVYLSTSSKFTNAQASSIVLVAVVVASVLIPIAGHIGTKVGYKRLLLSSYVAYALISIPSFLLMQRGSIIVALAGLAIGMIPYALCQAGTYSMLPVFFPVKFRHSGVAFGHSIAAVIGGGAGPYLAEWLINITGDRLVPAYMMVVAGLFGIIVLLKMRHRDVAV